MDQDDPPLFAALAAFHGLTPRHELREDRMSYRDQPASRVTDTGPRYGADDDPQGPPAPPLDIGEPLPAAPIRPEVVFSPQIAASGLVTCPTCGGGVHPDRIRD